MRTDSIVREFAPAKVNLALHVRRRREDGYHDIETLFAFCRHGDTIALTGSAEPKLVITGEFADALRGERENLISHAAEAFRATFRVDGHHAITLDKRLPIASGVGGGSADAAATLRALARLYDRPFDHPYLTQCAASLGADVPACLLGTATRGSGRGDALIPISGLGDMPALLVNPRIAVSTAAVFARWDGQDHGPLPEGDALTVAREGRNDLQPPACALAPAIEDVLAALDATGCTLARMSGSGATCFALFDRTEDRDRADAMIARSRPDWWRLATTIA